MKVRWNSSLVIFSIKKEKKGKASIDTSRQINSTHYIIISKDSTNCKILALSKFWCVVHTASIPLYSESYSFECCRPPAVRRRVLHGNIDRMCVNRGRSVCLLISKGVTRSWLFKSVVIPRYLFKCLRRERLRIHNNVSFPKKARPGERNG